MQAHQHARAEPRSARPESSVAPDGPQQRAGASGNAARAERLGLGSGQGAGETGPVTQSAGDLAAPSVAIPAGPQAKPAAATGPTITIENFVQSPDGSKDRKTVGLGEVTYFTPEFTGVKFSSSGGTGSMEKDGTYKWVAPATAGDHTITATDDTGTTTIKMKVVAPTSVAGTKTSEYTAGYAAGSHGAGMYLDLILQPTAVNFQNLEWKEEQGPITGTGIMKGRELGIRHNPKWVSVGSKNEIKDTAEHHGFPKPWDAGTTEFDVEQHYRVGAKGTATKFDTVKQVHEMFGKDGEAQERKAGAVSDKRTP